MRDWKFNIRPANGDDLNFIYSTWVNSIWSDCEKFRGIHAPLFFKEYPKVIDQILANPKTKTAIACKYDEPFVIFGYAIAEPPVAHYVFTKKNFWKMGVATALMEYLKAGEIYTHRTGMLQHILSKKTGHTFNPYLLYKQGESQ